MSFRDKVWLITGASKGLGLATAKHALARGARVAATSRDARKLATEMAVSGDRFLALEATLVDEASVRSAVQATVSHFGRLDVLVNNAGYSILGALEEISDAEARANFDINVFGVLNMTRAVLPTMRAQRSGHIINVSSISGSIGGPTTGIYSATKAAVLLLSESLAAEARELGIHVTAICPGGFRTDFLDKSSSRQPHLRIDDYRTTHAMLDRYARLNQHQSGNPAKAAEAIAALTEMEQPPTRLYLGADALRSISAKLVEVTDGVRQYERISLSTGFEE